MRGAHGEDERTRRAPRTGRTVRPGYPFVPLRQVQRGAGALEFINSLLGWDVENRRGLPEAYREVVYEDRVKVGGGTKEWRR
jgi:hypothetical protein